MTQLLDLDGEVRHKLKYYLPIDVLLQEDETLMDICMVKWEACQLDIYLFYTFKMVFEGTNEYAHERLEDPQDFAVYLPVPYLSSKIQYSLQ